MDSGGKGNLACVNITLCNDSFGSELAWQQCNYIYIIHLYIYIIHLLLLSWMFKSDQPFYMSSSHILTANVRKKFYLLACIIIYKLWSCSSWHLSICFP